MNSADKIRKMENIITEYAGPIARYILRGEIRRLGYTEENFPENKMAGLARKVIDESVMDPEWKEICTRRVYREVLRK